MIERFRALAAASVVVGLALVPAQAKSLLDGVEGKLADTPAASSGTLADFDAAVAKADAAWTAMPLGVRHALFVTQKGAGYGIYEARTTNEFKPGETLYIYAEPIGYVWKPVGAAFTFGVIADLAIKDSEGNALYDKPGFANLTLTSRARNKEFMLNFDVTVTGLKPGAYKLGIELHDINGTKTTTFDLPFKIAG